MDTCTQVLIRILTATDALWLPNRDTTNYSRAGAITEARALFSTSGVMLPSLAGPGAAEAQRQAATRAVRELVDRSMIRTGKPKWARATSYSLTEAGDTFSRALAGLPTIHDIRPTLERLRRLAAHPLALDAYDRTWTNELHLANVPWPGAGQGGKLADEHLQKIANQVEDLAPALCRGLVVSRCTAQRLVHFALTPEGMDFLASPDAPTPKLPKARQEVGEFYDSEFSAALARLATAQPRQPGELGDVPLPVTPEKARPGASEALQVYLQTGVIE